MPIARWILFTGLVWMTGCVTVRWLLAGVRSSERDAAADASEDPNVEMESLDRRLGGLGLLSVFMALVGMAGLGVAQLLAFRDPFASLRSEAELLFLRTSWGHAWTIATGGLLLAALAFTILRRGRETRPGRTRIVWLPLTGLIAALAAFPAFVGHAIGSERLTALAVVADGLHVLAAGAWLGSLGVIVLLFILLRSPGPRGDSPPGDLMPRFSAVALGSAAVLATTGLFASWLHLPSLSALLESGYGRLLLLKLAVVGSVAAFGFGNWRRWVRSQRIRGIPEIHPRWALLEMMVAHVVLAVTAVLVGTAPSGGP